MFFNTFGGCFTAQIFDDGNRYELKEINNQDNPGPMKSIWMIVYWKGMKTAGRKMAQKKNLLRQLPCLPCRLEHFVVFVE